MKKLQILLIIILSLGTLFLVSPQKVQAAGSLYLSPGARSVAQGANFSIGVRINTGGDPVNGVQANLAYPANMLDFIGISASGTAFEIQAEAAGGGGAVRIARGTLSPKSGDRLVATVTFRAKLSSGSAAVSFAGGSAVVRSTDNADILAGSSGGTYSFSPPLPVPTPTPVATSSASVDNTPLEISDVKLEEVGLNKATISWKTNKPATSHVEYGPSEKLGITASDTNLKTEHKLALESKLLVPGTTYYYQVKSKDEADNEVAGQIEKFQTKGFKVKIRVLDSEGRPLAGVKVILYSERLEAVTNQDGIVEFNNVSPGKHSSHVVVGKQTFADEINVKESLAEPQEYTLNVATGGVSTGQLVVYAVGLAVGLLVILGAGSLWWFKFRKKPTPDLTSGNTDDKGSQTLS